jgi:hypothetical protein
MDNKPNKNMEWDHIVLAKTKGFKLTAMQPKTKIKGRPNKIMFYHEFSGLKSELYPTLTKAMESEPLFYTETVLNQIEKEIRNVINREDGKQRKA